MMIRLLKTLDYYLLSLLLSFTTVTGTSVGIASPSIGLVSLIINKMSKCFCKSCKKSNSCRIIALLVNSKLNSIEKIKSRALVDSDIIYDKFILAINKEQNYLRLKERIRTKGNKLGDIERDRLIEHSKRIKINEILSRTKEKSMKFKTEV